MKIINIKKMRSLTVLKVSSVGSLDIFISHSKGGREIFCNHVNYTIGRAKESGEDGSEEGDGVLVEVLVLHWDLQ